MPGPVRVANASGYWGDDPEALARQVRGGAIDYVTLGRPLREIRERIVAANAYLGAWPIAEALGAGAQIVVNGRTTDVALTVGPQDLLGLELDVPEAVLAATPADGEG